MSNTISKLTPVINGVVNTSAPTVDTAPKKSPATPFPAGSEAVWNSVKAATNANAGGPPGLVQSPQQPLGSLDNAIPGMEQLGSSTLMPAIDPASEDLKSLDDLSETESLRLQMKMDSRSKFLETLSNVLKKDETTGEAITDNLK